MLIYRAIPRVSDACNIATNKRNWHSLQMELIPKVAKLIDQPVNNRNGKHEWKRDSFEWMWKSNRDSILFFLLGNRHLDGGLYCLRLCCSYWVHSGDLIDYETFWYCKIIVFHKFSKKSHLTHSGKLSLPKGLSFRVSSWSIESNWYHNIANLFQNTF